MHYTPTWHAVMSTTLALLACLFETSMTVAYYLFMLTVNNKKIKKKTRRFINEVVAFDYYFYVSLYFIITAKYIKYKVNLRNGQKSQDVLVTLYNTTHKVY